MKYESDYCWNEFNNQKELTEIIIKGEQKRKECDIDDSFSQ